MVRTYILVGDFKLSDGTKVCKKCGKELPLSEFPTFKDKGVIRYRGDCKVCLAKYKQKNYTENKEVYLTRAKENRDEKNAKRRANYAKKNKEELNEKRRKEYEKNKEHINEVRKGYRGKEENKERINEQKRNSYNKHKEDINERQREKYASDKDYAESVKQRSSKWYAENTEKANFSNFLRYNILNNATIVKQQAEYRNLNRQKIRDRAKVYRKTYPDKVAEQKAQEYLRNKDTYIRRRKVYYELNKAKILQHNKNWLKTEAGKLSKQKFSSRRRELGFNPINSIFENAEYHHLMCKKSSGECDKEIGLFIPAKLHRSVAHDGNKGRNMDKMNKLALEWYINNTPKSKIKLSVYELCKLYNVNIK